MRSRASGAVAALLGVALLVLGVPTASAGTAPAAPLLPRSVAAVPSSFVFTGSGWGHGLGMSQYGAYGQALEGRTATQILEHYYEPAKVTSVSRNPEIRVQVLSTPKTATLTRTSGTWQLVFGPGSADVLALPGSSLVVTYVSGRVEVTVAGSLYRTSSTMPELYVEWSGTRYLAGSAGVVALAGANAGTGTVSYRHGRLALRPYGGGPEVISEVLLNTEYLYGLAEMPSSWPAAALQAQAIAGRSYALRAYDAGPRANSAHLTDETSSQKYTAWNKESEATYGVRWKSAVDATLTTAGAKVVTHGGALVQTFYSSSSGGRTTDSEDVWGGAELPYLRSRDDHWAVAAAVRNPRADWSVSMSQAAVAAIFGLPDVVSLAITRTASSGAVMQVRATATSGAGANLLTTPTTDGVRTRLGLNSAYFALGARSSVERLAGDDRYSTAVAIGRAAFDSSYEVVLVSGRQASLVDGLVAGPFARSHQAPILLTDRDTIPAVTLAELERRSPSKVWIIGGTGAVSDGVATQVRKLGIAVTRVAGADRYATAAAVAALMPSTGRVVVVSGAQANLVDAVGASGPAAALGQPIVLTKPTSLPAPSLDALTAAAPSRVYVVGGTGAVSESVVSAISALGVPVNRFWGRDRYATAVAVADQYEDLIASHTVVLAAGTDDHLVDALTGGALGNLVLLTAPSSVTPVTRNWLAAREVPKLRVLGGTGAVSTAVVEAVR